MKYSRLVLALPVLGALTLSACVENAPSDSVQADGVSLSVSSTDDDCVVSADTTESGNTVFSISNEGSRTTEFYLLGADGLRIVSEKENIAPGQTTEMSVSLQPGEYYTACKPGMRGANVGQAAFTVTGDPVEISGADEELFAKVVADYVNFVKNEVAELEPKVEEFATAYMEGDDDTARALYPRVRVHYERIEPVAEALGILDPRIDYREVDYLAEADLLKEDDPTFTEWLGFHRIEKDLWVPARDQLQPDGTSAWEGWAPSDDAQRRVVGTALIADVGKLYDAVHADDFVETSQMDIATVANGASALLEEIAITKVTGEENWWSHYDLWDFQANLEGSRIAFDLVAPIAEAKSDEGRALVKEIRKQFDDTQILLNKYGNLDEGFVLYNEVSEDQRRELVAQIDALREPLSKLTNAVLGIDIAEQ
ncbi:iron uptake system protein EfeO [Corynebacterium pacaense]|uniref:iron uptake system protein EfeO n=1 Tax=Corynebacterium pacaense TaxID=1816684 RepID=UPI0009BC5D81|nr:iron uptake system protein EfeO [Corynebacterium pacaense]